MLGRGFCFLSPIISPRASGACYARGFAPHRALLSQAFRDTARRVLAFSDCLRPRCVHRHASGAAHSWFGALPALCHKSKPSAGNARLPPSGCIRGFTLAAPAINQSGRGSYVVVSALLYSRLTRPESSVSMRAAICGAAAAAFFYARRYAARSHRS